MFARTTRFFVGLAQRYVPDPYLFAVILTLLVAVAVALAVPGTDLSAIVNAWYAGVWGSQNIFIFALQMILILVCGYTLAQAPLVKRGLRWLADRPNNQVQSAVLVFVTGAVTSFFNWGLGLVVGALLAKEIAKRRDDVDFGFLVAAAYMGFITWASGFSSSIVLANADRASALNWIYKLTKQTVPVSETLGAAYNLVPVFLTIIVLSVALKYMAPEKIRTVDRQRLADADTSEETAATVESRPSFATRVEQAWILNVFVAAAGLYYFVFIAKGALTIDTMIMLFTVAGLLLHWRPIRFIAAFKEAAKTSGPLLLQYPLYGGIMALIVFSPDPDKVDSLAVWLAESFVSGASATTLPFLNYLASIVITLFVPSGGGHWAVQAPISIEAARLLGETSPHYLGKISMSVAFGEQVGNMIQPFWALPLLAIAQLGIRDIMGYCVIALFIGTVLFGGALLLL
ncbi:short-chain fatty acids transporter [Marinithermofilum abyssi]|uniref:Short-chain fatty acids transporter n=1 Tax=Marinithermofilum abyssi TaxID=1571185 RepID=A0A8J2YCQ6_9BACL|nr:TIGR00366 family protein [Marinithermofilum abyssi]GGE03824.1 short-chain fatty acids transporter [Marinithermofilum abyssi]